MVDQNGCIYLQSDEWLDKLFDDINDAWTGSDLVWQLSQVNTLDDFERVSSKIRDFGISEDEMNNMCATELASELSGSFLEISRKNVREFWESEHNIPNGCPYDASSGKDYCIFHQKVTEKSDDLVRDQLLDELQSDKNTKGKKKVFTGAKFGDLNLKHLDITTTHNYPLDFQYADIEGDFVLSKAAIQVPLKFHRMNCSGEAVFSKSRFDQEFDASRATFRNDADFVEARFENRAEFSEVKFIGSGNFERATFQGEAWFYASQFHGFCMFINVTFEEDAIFTFSQFNHTDFSYAEFNGKGTFDKATFFSHGGFGGTIFNQMASFEESDCVEDILSFRNSAISNGNFVLPSQSNNVHYDFSEASIGDVKLSATKEDEDFFRHFRMYNTSFDGFQFGNYTNKLSPDWYIHKFDRQLPYGQEDDDYPQLVNTYLKAKNGAKQVGDYAAASRFFVNEMRYRRKLAQERLENEKIGIVRSIQLRSKILANWLFDVSTQYGEKPWRIFFLSVFTIISFTIIFPFTSGIRTSNGVILRHGFDEPLTNILQTLYFSVTTFTTVGYGDLQPAGMSAQFVAAIESFIGVFLISFLVFVLGRSVKW